LFAGFFFKNFHGFNADRPGNIPLDLLMGAVAKREFP